MWILAKASSSLTDEDGVYLHESVVCGHHIYKRVWSPIIGKVLLREEESERNRFAVCLLKPRAVKVGTSLENCSVRFDTF